MTTAKTKQAIVSAYIQYMLKATNGKYYAFVAISDMTFFVEVAYFDLASHLKKSIRVRLEAFDKQKQFTIPAYGDKPAHREYAFGKISKPLSKAGFAEFKKMTELI